MQHFSIQSVAFRQNVSLQVLQLHCTLLFVHMGALSWLNAETPETVLTSPPPPSLWQACKVLFTWVLFRETTVSEKSATQLASVGSLPDSSQLMFILKFAEYVSCRHVHMWFCLVI